MIRGFFRTAAATPKIKVADVSYNTEAVLRILTEAEKEGVQLLTLPELVLTGYTCADLFHQTLLIEKTAEALDRLAEATRGRRVMAVVGVPYSVGHKLYNCAAVLFQGHILALIPKKNLPNYSEFYERRWFTPGPEEVTLLPHRSAATGERYTIPFGMRILIEAENRPDFRLACEVCEDIWVPNPPSTEHVLAGATVIANASASDEMVGKDSYRRELIRSASARLVSVYCYANAGDGESSTDLIFGGQDIIAENGSIVTEGVRFRTGLYIADVDLERITQERARMTTFPEIDPALRAQYTIVPVQLPSYDAAAMQEGQTKEPARPALASVLAAEAAALRRYVDPQPFVPRAAAERNARCEEIFTMQALGLRKRLEHIGAKTAVIGISGGLDSTLALLVTARAFDLLGLPRENITSVTMPAFGTTDRTYHNAVTLTHCLGATLREINIKAAVLQHFQDIGHDVNDHSVTYENSQARERTQLLMDIANQVNGIVIGTGDLSELALGWATYNGDHMSMYAVNVGVPKTLVRYLVHFVADTAEEDALRKCLMDIFDTPVSPELLPPTGDGKISQKTEDLVGPYELHDFFLYQILRFGFGPRKVYALALRAFSSENQGNADTVYDAATILKWLRKFYWRFFSQQFKRSCLPDGPKVGSVAVSPRGDLRMPSDAAVTLWITELETLEEGIAML